MLDVLVILEAKMLLFLQQMTRRLIKLSLWCSN